jgi:hypothetical protein
MNMTGNHNLLVRYNCGCIGFRPDTDGNAMFIKCCDGPAGHDELEIFERNSEGKSFQPIPRELENELLGKLSVKVSNGYRLEEMRQILRTAS